MNGEQVKKTSRKLRVQAGEFIGGIIRVEWRIDDAHWKGVINVQMPDGMEDAQAIAELCALRHLVVGRRVFGSDTASPGATIIVSAGAVKKLWRQDTAKGHIVPYGRFLYATFDGCEMDVKKDRALAALPVREFDLEAQEPRADIDNVVAAPSPFPEITFRALGGIPVGISRHALERYQERFSTRHVKTSMAGIRKIADSEQLTEIVKGERARIMAEIRHQTSAKLYMYQPSRTILVIVPEGPNWVLATVYREDETQSKQAVYAGGRIEFRNRN